jgi:hypothetical protein
MAVASWTTVAPVVAAAAVAAAAAIIQAVHVCVKRFPDGRGLTRNRYEESQ